MAAWLIYATFKGVARKDITTPFWSYLNTSVMLLAQDSIWMWSCELKMSWPAYGFVWVVLNKSSTRLECLINSRLIAFTELSLFVGWSCYVLAWHRTLLQCSNLVENTSIRRQSDVNFILMTLANRYMMFISIVMPTLPQLRLKSFPASIHVYIHIQIWLKT